MNRISGYDIIGGAGDKWDKFCKHCGRKMTNCKTRMRGAYV